MVHFKDLKAWQHARSLTVLSHQAIARLPASERNVLGEQWRRAAYRAVLHIAEGARRPGSSECRRHLVIARASLNEIEMIIDLAVGLDYLRRVEIAKLEAVRDACAKTVYGLLRKLESPGPSR